MGTEPEEESADRDTIAAQAAHLETVMPAIAQRLFTVAPTHPLADMPIAQLRVCSLLLTLENPTMSQVADELHISVSAVTQIADRLEKAGMVERVPASEANGEHDRRARHLRLTEKGFSLLRSRRHFRQSGARRALAHLTSEERGRLLESLETLLQASRMSAADTEDVFDEKLTSPG
ncbi:MAG: MarR family transcriptional regulator [Cytophagales bacterium]|nr:MarR family transcriptional regulator [Armatimonadota bacterium]